MILFPRGEANGGEREGECDEMWTNRARASPSGGWRAR